jgi:hypothetical protein
LFIVKKKKRDSLLLQSELLLGLDAQLVLEGSELIQVLLVKSIRASLDLQSLENTDGSGVVINASGGLEGSSNDGGRGNEIVAEGVVQSTLELEDIIDVVKELDEALSVVLEGLLTVLRRVVAD